MNQKNSIYREKSVKKMDSSVELNKYLRVTKPSLWIALVALILLLLGAIVWASVAKVETTCWGAVKVEDGNFSLIVTETNYQKTSSDSTFQVYIDGERTDTKYPLNLANSLDFYEFSDMDSKTIYYGDLDSNESVVAMEGSGLELPDGFYPAIVILDEVSPIQFLFK